VKSKSECLYYLVREMGELGVPAKDSYFEDVLEYVRQSGLDGMCQIEVKALIMAAEYRGRLKELDAVVAARIGCN
jgi:hypothetical protein